MLTTGNSSSKNLSAQSSSQMPVTQAQKAIDDALDYINQAIEQKKLTFAAQRLETLVLDICLHFASPLQREHILSYPHQVAGLSAPDRTASIQTQPLEQKLFEELKPEINSTLPTMIGEIKRLYDKASAQTDYLSSTAQIRFYQGAGDNYRRNHGYLEAVLAYTEGVWIAEYSNIAESALSQALWERLSSLEQPMLKPLQQMWFKQQGETTMAAVKAKIEQLKITVTAEMHDIQRYPHLLDFFKQINALLAPLTAEAHVGILTSCYTELEPYLKQWVEVLQTVLSSERSSVSLNTRFEDIKPLLSFWMNHRWHPLAAETVLRSCDHLLTTGNKIKTLDENLFTQLLQYNNLISAALLNPELQTLLPKPRPIPTTTVLHAKTLVAARKLCMQEKEHPDASKKFTQTVIEILNKLIEECVAILGEAPCGFCVLGVGSLARGELCLRSDIDIAFLIDNADYRNSAYFSYLVDVLQTKLRCLGESNGICIDEEDIASIKLGKLIHTPESYVATYMVQCTLEQDMVLAYKLLCVKALWCNSKGEFLLEHYQQLVTAQLNLGKTQSIAPEHKNQGLRYLKVHQRQWVQRHNTFEDKLRTTVDLKKDYLQPLLFWCLDIALYFGLVEPDKPSVLRYSVPALLTELGARRHIHSGYIHAVRTAWDTIQKTRFQLHHASILYLPSKRRHNLKPDEASFIELKSPNHSTNTADIFSNLSLNPEQQSGLTTIYKGVLKPAYQTLDELQEASRNESDSSPPFDPMHAWFTRQLTRYQANEHSVVGTEMRSIIRVWAKTLYQRNASVAAHLASYKQLPDTLKGVYYKAIKRFTPSPNLLNAIGTIPFKDGTCLAYTDAQTQWQTFLSQQLTRVLPVDEKIPVKETARQFSTECLIQWLNPEGKLCSGFLHSDFQTAWERAGYLNQHGFDLARIKAPLDHKAEVSISRIDGRGYVFPILNGRGQHLAYAKLYPEMPGRQALAESLAWHLSGYGAMSTLCKVTHLATKQVYPLLISQFKGETLQNHLRQARNLTDWERKIDEESFTLKFLETLLLSYEDDKFDNITLEPFVNREGEIRYRLISFDVDRAFAESFLKEDLTEKNILRKQLKINAKSAVYCLDAMHQRLHPEVVARFCEMQPLTLFTHWLQEPLTTHLTRSLFSPTEAVQVSSDKEHECYIPAIFELGTGSRIYQRFLRIQEILRGPEPPQTHLELFSWIEPHLASFYKSALQKPLSAKERFDQLPTHYKVSEEKLASIAIVDGSIAIPTAHPLTTIPSPRPLRIQQTTGSTRTRMLNSITIPAAKGDFKRAIAEGAIAGPAYVLKTEIKPTHNHYQAIQTIRQALLNGNSKPFLALNQVAYKTDDLKAQILQLLDWSTLKPRAPQTLEQLQEEILNALIGGKYYHLSFTNCTALTDDKLTKIVKDSLELQVLDVSGCIQLDGTAIRALATPHSLLHTLNMSYLPNLRYFSHVSTPFIYFTPEPTLPLNFPQLRRLNLSHCENLSMLRLEDPHLVKHFSLEGCIGLNDLWQKIALLFANAPTVKMLNLSSNKALHKPEGFKLFRTLTAALKNNRTLTWLDLSNNKLDFEYAQMLAEALTDNRTLRSLYMGRNNLGPKGVEALAEILKKHPTLTSLDLGDNDLGLLGFQAMAKMLQHNCTLTSLNFWGNKLDTESIQALAEAIQHNHTLTVLNLDWNDLNSSNKQALDDLDNTDEHTLTEALKRNQTLAECKQSKQHTSTTPIQVSAEMKKAISSNKNKYGKKMRSRNTFFHHAALETKEEKRASTSFTEDFLLNSNKISQLLEHLVQNRKDCYSIRSFGAINLEESGALVVQLFAARIEQKSQHTQGLSIPTIYLLPIHLGNHHWAALYLHFITANFSKIIVRYSGHGGHTYFPSVIKEALLTVYGHAAKMDILVCPSALQTEAYHCGVCVVATFEALLNTGNFPTNIDVQAKRLEYEMLLQNTSPLGSQPASSSTTAQLSHP